MSDKPIQVGDLVMVIRPSQCKCSAPNACLGKIFKVLHLAKTTTVCSGCGKLLPEENFAWYDCRYPGHGVGVWRLKRIDPDALKDDVPAGEELTA